MLRRITIFGVLAAIALAALAATSPSVIRRFSGDILVEGQVYGLEDLWFDETNSVKSALTNHTHDASKIVSGTIGTARLGSGTPSSTTFLRGDSTWAELSGGGDADTLGGQAGSWYLARSNHTGSQVLATISDAGTAAARNVPASGNAGATEAVLGNDTRLSDARTPTSHAHAGGDITSGTVGTARLGSGTANSTTFLRGDGSWAGIPDDTAADTLGGQVGSWYLARANHTGSQVLATISDAGTAAARNVPASGNAGATEAVLGNDTRLSDARTPTSHAHAGGDITSGTVGTARLGSGTANSTTFLRGDGSWAGIPDDTAADTLGGQVGSWYLARSNHTGTQAHTTITGLGGLAVVNDPTSDGKVYGRSLGGWVEVLAAQVGTNNPVHGNLLIKTDLPTVFFSDDASDTGGGIVFGVGGFVIGPANYGNPDYVGTPWMEISTNGLVTIADDLISWGDGEFGGSVSGTEHFGNRITLSTASNTNAPAAGKAAIFLRQVGGKGQLVVRFPTGADQVIATEP